MARVGRPVLVEVLAASGVSFFVVVVVVDDGFLRGGTLATGFLLLEAFAVVVVVVVTATSGTFLSFFCNFGVSIFAAGASSTKINISLGFNIQNF